VLCVFPSGARKQITWSHPSPIVDTLTTAKTCMAHLVDHMLARGLHDDLERTNIPSAVAAIQRVIADHNEAWRRAHQAVN
jgi:hypothetical protein